MAIKKLQDTDALLLYKVGPVFCCSPTLTVEAVILPPKLTHAPGYSEAEPGVFKHSCGIVHVVDLRKRFGVDHDKWHVPGKIIIVEVEGGYAGFWVDEIIDVIHFPEKGWSNVPACIPRDVFKRTLLLNKIIQLYCDFESLFKFKETGYLREYIASLVSSNNVNNKNNKVTERLVASGAVNNKVETALASAKTPELIKAALTQPENKTSPIASNELSDLSRSHVMPLRVRHEKKLYKNTQAVPVRDRSNKENNPLKLDDQAQLYGHRQSREISQAYIGNSESVEIINIKSEIKRPISNVLIDSDSNDWVFFSVIICVFCLMMMGAWYFLFDSNDVQVVSNGNTRRLDLDKIDNHFVQEIEVESIEDKVIADVAAVEQKKEYHAEIKQDKEMVTIVVEVAKDDRSTDILIQQGDVIKKEETEIKVLTASDANAVAQSTKKKNLAKEVIHIVVKGDTLWHIAKRYIKNPYRYPELARLSKIKNPDLIYPGNKVKIVINGAGD